MGADVVVPSSNPCRRRHGPVMKIGLLGGSFDPIHVGHLVIAQDALEGAGLDRVVFVPAAVSP